MDRIVLVGRYPPPLGGISVHVQRLAQWLARDGYSVSLLDTFSNTAYQFDGKEGAVTQVPLAGRKGLLSYLSRASRGAVVHFHIAAGGNFYRVAPILFLTTRRARQRVLTIHSGRWQTEFENSRVLSQRLIIRLISGFDQIVCVNQEQADFLSHRVAAAVQTIPAYLPGVHADAALPNEVESFVRNLDTILISSGSGAKIYGYDLIMEALQQVSTNERKMGLVLATYGVWDQSYLHDLEEQLAGAAVPTLVTHDLTPDQFLELLSRCHIYVRPSLTDGDSVAVREAISMGCQIVASDAAPRPQGTAVFTSGDANSLAGALQVCLDEDHEGRPDPHAVLDYYQQILEVYKKH